MKNKYSRNYTTNQHGSTRTITSKFVLFALLFFTGFFAYGQTSPASQVLILPVTGVTPDEARTIANFVSVALTGDPKDISGNTALVPAGGRPWGIGPGAVANMVNLIKEHNAKEAIGVNIAVSGTGKMATVRRFDDKGKLSRIFDIQYNDPFEFWIKLQQPDETFRRGEGGPVWVIYRQGVNRAEAEELMQLWFNDLVSMGAQGLKDIDDQTASFEAAVAAMEKESADWQAVIDENIQYFKNMRLEKKDPEKMPTSWDAGLSGPFYIVGDNNQYTLESDFNSLVRPITGKIPSSYPRDRPVLLFNVTRQGSRTRIEVIRRYSKTSDAATGSFITEFESAAQFRRNLRVNSFGLMNALYKEPLEYARANEAFRSTWTTDAAALSALKTSVAVPNTFIQVKRPPVNPGEVPGGGFYMSRNMVTQREWEAVMGSNPSRQKGANLPVHNVNLLEAMEYCNRLSLRDGLMPAYDIFFWEGIKRDMMVKGIVYGGDVGEQRIIDYPGQRAKVITDRYANGYRLPTPAEWDFALTNGAINRGVLIWDLTESKEIEDYGWFQSNSSGRVQPVGQKKPINGFYDLLGNVMEYVFYGEDFETKGDKRNNIRAYVGATSYLRGGDYRTDYNLGHRTQADLDSRRSYLVNIQRFVVGTSMPSVTMREYTEIMPVGLDKIKIPNVEFTPGFRVVRPVFDYWAYRSGNSSVTAWPEPAALVPENSAQLETERKAALAKIMGIEAARMEAVKNEAIRSAMQRQTKRKAVSGYTETLPGMEQKGRTLILHSQLNAHRNGSVIPLWTGRTSRSYSPNGDLELQLTRIEITNKTMIMYLNANPCFKDNPQNILLLDMDSQQIYNPTRITSGNPIYNNRGNEAANLTPGTLTFTGVTGSRFTLISTNISPPYYVDEIFTGIK